MANEQSVAGLDRDKARQWIARWDAQQEIYLPDREDRFTAMIDAVQEGAGRDDPLVLDLGCGPGSLAVRLLDRLPSARVMAIDNDPLLLTLGRAAYPARDGLAFTDLDLRTPGWAGSLHLDRPADAAVSTTALHWLQPAQLRAMYAEVATVLRPGGLLLNGDHLTEDEAATPTLARLDRALIEAEERRRAPEGHAESWKEWWQAVTEDRALAGPAAQREQRRLSEDHHGSESVRLGEHIAALRAAGFAEVGTIWQRGENRVLCAVKGGVVTPADVPDRPLSHRVG
ncbi:MAG TPA: class I SAM-dependent methyltransferase [Streptosporangiaceae bacterium]|nr:class I SAM-dependent methyltransferase [Streptosporangiaceae bacterium]